MYYSFIDKPFVFSLEKKSVLIFFFILIAQKTFSQAEQQIKTIKEQMKMELSREDLLRKSTMDSLNNALRFAKHDTDKINIYHALCDACEIKDNIKYSALLYKAVDEALTKNISDKERVWMYIRKAEAIIYEMIYYQSINQINTPHYKRLLDQKHKLYLLTENPRLIAESFLGKADYYQYRSEKMLQLNTLKEGLAHSKKLKYYKGMNRFNLQLCLFYAAIGDTSEAIRYYEKGQKIEALIGDSTRLMRSNFLAGYFFTEIKQFKKAIVFFNKSLEQAKKENDTTGIIELYSNIAITYYAMKEYNKARTIALEAATLSEQTYNFQYYFLNLKLLGQICVQNKNMNVAIDFHQKCLEIAQMINTDQPLFYANLFLAQDYFYFSQYVKAKPFSDKALFYSQNLDLKVKIDGAFMAYRVDSALQQYKSALSHYQSYVKLKEKSSNEQLLKISEREKFNRDLEKQKISSKMEEAKREALNAEEKQKQRIILYSVSIVLLLSIFLVVFIYRGYRLKQKSNNELLSKNETIARQKLLVEEKHREITDSINYAERIQRSFLAGQKLLEENLSDFFIFFKPKDIVSGDFYWASKANDLFYIAVCDSTGHGVPGAIMSILNISCIENAINEGHESPAAILNHTRENIIERLKNDGSAEGGKDGMDATLMAFDFNTNKMLVAVANNPVWIRRGEELIEIKPDKMPVGKHDKQNQPFTSHEIQLQKGDVVYALTDGFPDQFGGEKGKKYMIKNLRTFLSSISQFPMLEQKDKLKRAFSDWKGINDQVDDVCVMGIKV